MRNYKERKKIIESWKEEELFNRWLKGFKPTLKGVKYKLHFGNIEAIVNYGYN